MSGPPKTRILAVRIFIIMFVATNAGSAVAGIGESWSLSGDMQVTSNPCPAIDPGAPGAGSATWTYERTDMGPFTASVDGNLGELSILKCRIWESDGTIQTPTTSA